MNGLRSLILPAALLLSGCATTHTYVAPGRNIPEHYISPDSVEYEVYLVGDTGSGAVENAAHVLRALAGMLQNAPEESAVVFLGDQLLRGMPDSAAAGRPEANQRLEMIAGTVRGFSGRVFVLPGDQDWDGPESVRRQEDELEALLGREDVFIPGDARPGPVVLELTNDLVLIGLDTAWWLEDEPKPFGDAGDIRGDEGGYEIANSGDIIFAVEDALKKYDDENVLVVGHHPLRSNGPRGGQFTLGRYLSPLPIVGTPYALYRQFAGTRQDLAYPRYRAYRLALEDIFREHDRVIYASAHERSLEAFPLDESTNGLHRHYLISGSAAQGVPVASGRGAGLASSERGFMRLRYMNDGSVWLDTYSVESTADEAAVIYHSRLFDEALDRVNPELPEINPETLPSYADSTVVVAVDITVPAGKIRRLLLGSGYRRGWETPVRFPVFDMSRDGGLEPLQQGGGMQTTSLRLKAGNGHQYVLRLLRKDPGRLLPTELSESVAADVLNDLTLDTIPWGALAAAKLGDSVGLYHTNPQIVFIPDDPRLGVYRQVFANQLALFEERGSGDMSDLASFGNSDDVISTAKMFDKVEGDNDHRVDQRFYLRARLLDMLIADWDRHTDQWRWATFEPFQLHPSLEGDARTDGKIYRPVPRDRDQAFNLLGGLLPWIARQIEPKLASFQKRIGNPKGLTTSGIPLDRRFTTELTLEDWVDIANDLRDSISDRDVEEAFATWPPEIFSEYGTRSIEVLQARRDQLPEVAEKVYRLYARDVDVAGSNKHELFDVNINSNGSVEVVILKTKRDGEVVRELYRRNFSPNETHEVRLYGLGGHDQFVIAGADNSAISIRIIGGGGEDSVVNDAGARVFYYDTVAGNNLEDAGRTQIRLSDAPENNRYDPEDYRFPRSLLAVIPGYSTTDGFILGGNLTIHRPGFREYPWAISHFISGSFATNTLGLRGRYRLRLYDALGEEWDGVFDAGVATANYVNNFYGFGNETSSTGGPASFYHAGLAEFASRVSVIRRVEQSIEFQFGGGPVYTKVADDSTTFVSTPAAGLPATVFQGALFANGFTSLVLNAVDNSINPRQGFKWINKLDFYAGVNAPSSTFASVGSEVVIYGSPILDPQLTLAGRAGFGRNLGSFPFYYAQTLGGSTNLRGFRSQRYSGRTVAYQSIEARARLVDALSRTFPISIGVLGFADNGRVWADGESSTSWHQGFGGGFWFDVLDLSVLSTTIAHGDDGLQFNVGLNFFY